MNTPQNKWEWRQIEHTVFVEIIADKHITDVKTDVVGRMNNTNST